MNESFDWFHFVLWFFAIIAIVGLIVLDILYPSNFFRTLDKNIIIPRLFP